MKYKLLKTKALAEIILVITLSFIVGFSLNSETVQAQEQVCCEQTNTGQYCQYTDVNNCDPSNRKAPTTCDKASFCRPGCCDLNQEGEGCFKYTGKAACDALGGQYSSDPGCPQAECQSGCCVLGSNCQFGTETSCKNLYNTYAPDLSYDFRAAQLEVECLNICLKQETGCCVSEDGCQRATGNACDAEGGEFSGRLCSEQSSGVCDECKGEKTTGCVEGSTDIWTFDSCGNQERVSKECDYADGKICGQNAADNECDDLSCSGGLWDSPSVDENKDGDFENDKNMFRQNGESWCEYDANTGPTIDLPGTRHYRHACINGKEVVEECKDYRDEICFSVTNADTGEDSAACIKNRFEDCATCESKGCCENGDARDCFWVTPGEQTQEELKAASEAKCSETDEEGNPLRSCQIPEESKDGFCIPRVPPGGQFWKGDGGGLCSTATQKEDGIFEPVTVNWEKLLEWDCEDNCIAYTPEYAATQNSFCLAYGDCGSHYNTVGGWGNEGFSRPCDKGDDDHNLKDGDVADDNLKNSLTRFGDGDEKGNELLDACTERVANPNNFKDVWLRNQGILSFGEVYESDFGLSDEQVAALLTGGVPALSLAAGVVITTFVEGASFSLLPLAGFIGGGLALPIIGLIIGIGLALTAAIIYLAGDSYPATITTECSTWQAPRGGDDCNLCHEAGERSDGSLVDLTAEGLHECTEYLCKSLGSGCEFANTEEGGRCLSKLCTGSNADVNAPIIKLSEKMKNQVKCVGASEDRPAIGCQIPTQEQGRQGAEIKWVKANSDFVVELETFNEAGERDFATCRFDEELKANYDEMSQSFDQAGASSTHNLTFKASTDLESGKDYRYFIRCIDNCGNHKDAAPYELKISVANAPDLTAPLLEKISPENHALVPNAVNKTEIELTLNEKVLKNVNVLDAGCRLSQTDVTYEEMETPLLCPNPARRTAQRCEGLIDLNLGTNTFFIRCKDPKGNVNKQSLVQGGYTLVKTNALELGGIKCNNEACGSKTIFEKNVTISASTDSGAELGKATCGMSTADVDGVLETDFFFEETQGSSHKMTLGPLASREYSYHVVCEDKAGNVAKEEISFTVDVDEEAPQIRNVFTLGSSLIIGTNEDATCKYVNEGGFDYDAATSFGTTGGKTHSVSTAGQNYFVVGCRDRFENQMRLVSVHVTGTGAGPAPRTFVAEEEVEPEVEAPVEEPEVETPVSGQEITIENFQFTPSELIISKGETISWTNNDQASHLVTDDTGFVFDSGILENGESYSFTFTEVGTFAYHCDIHPSMTATITVE